MSDLAVSTDPAAMGPIEPASDIVASFCGRIAMLRPGERAALRRMNISTPARSAGLVTGVLSVGCEPVSDLRNDSSEAQVQLASNCHSASAAERRVL